MVCAGWFPFGRRWFPERHQKWLRHEGTVRKVSYQAIGTCTLHIRHFIYLVDDDRELAIHRAVQPLSDRPDQAPSAYKAIGPSLARPRS